MKKKKQKKPNHRPLALIQQELAPLWLRGGEIQYNIDLWGQELVHVNQQIRVLVMEGKASEAYEKVKAAQAAAK